MRLSIIVPVYKVQQTLERCLESIASQSFADWEAIIVDDGSPDGCPAMCDEWGKRDERFRVIHKENGGLSDARNAGLEQAAGEYITFVDSDDYLCPTTYEQLFQQLALHPEFDMLEYSFCKETEEGVHTKVTLPEHTYTDAQTYWLEGQAYQHAYAWNKVYRRQLFQGIRFPKGQLFEDVHTLPQLLSKAQMVATTTAGCYHYVENPKGITAQAKGEEWESLLNAHLKAVEQMGLFEHQLPPAAINLYLHLLNIQLYTYALTGKNPQLPYQRIDKVPSPATLSEKTKIRLLRILGIKRLCKLYRTFFRLTSNRS